MTNNNKFENCCKDTQPDKLELKENEDLCKGSFLILAIEIHHRKFTTELFDKRSYLMKDIPFHFISVVCRISTAIYHGKQFGSAGSKILTINDLINMVKRVNPLLMQMKRQGSECTRIISLLKKIFGKHFFKVLRKFVDTADKFIKLASSCI